MNTPLRTPLLSLVTAALLGLTTLPASADHDPFHRIVDTTEAYIGLTPVSAFRAFSGDVHPMHPTGRRGQHHLVVTLFDREKGRRINDAEVTASLGGLDLAPAQRKPLQMMRHGDFVSYGGFFYLPPGPHTSIALEVQRPGVEPRTIRFDLCPACRPLTHY